MLLSIGLLWIFAITVLVYQSVFFSVSKSNISSYVRNNKYLVLQRKMYFFFLLSWNISPLIFFLSLSRLLTVAIFFVLIMLINDVYILDLGKKSHTSPPSVVNKQANSSKENSKKYSQHHWKNNLHIFSQKYFYKLMGFLCRTISKNKLSNHPDLIKILLILL